MEELIRYKLSLSLAGTFELQPNKSFAFNREGGGYPKQSIASRSDPLCGPVVYLVALEWKVHNYVYVGEAQSLLARMKQYVGAQQAKRSTTERRLALAVSETLNRPGGHHEVMVYAVFTCKVSMRSSASPAWNPDSEQFEANDFKGKGDLDLTKRFVRRAVENSLLLMTRQAGDRTLNREPAPKNGPIGPFSEEFVKGDWRKSAGRGRFF